MVDSNLNEKNIQYYLQLPYPVQLSKQSEDGEEYWFAEILDLPGCMSDGSTPDEAMENIEEAKYLWIKSQLEDGYEVPEPSNSETYSGKILVRMPKTLHSRLAYQAQREGVSLNHYIVSLLSERGKAEEQIREVLDLCNQLPMRFAQLIQSEINAQEIVYVSTPPPQEDIVGTRVESHNDSFSNLRRFPLELAT